MVTVKDKLELLITSFFDNKGVLEAVTAVKRLKAGVDAVSSAQIGQGGFENASKSLAGYQNIAKDVGLNIRKSADGVVTFNDKVSGLTVPLDTAAARFDKFDAEAVKTFNSITKGANSAIPKANMGFKSLGKITKNVESKMIGLEKTLEDNSKAFQMWALGLMFGGMVVQKMFMRLATMGTSAFKEITDATDYNSTAVAQLGVWWQVLKFSLGQAVNAFIEMNPWIIKTIQNIAELIAGHQKLTGKLIFWGLIIGTVVMVLGQFILMAGSVYGAMSKLTLWTIRLYNWMSKLKMMKGIGTMFSLLGTKIKALTLKMWGLIVSSKTLGKSGKANMISFANGSLKALQKLSLWFLTNPIGLAILTLVAVITYLGVKWKWNWKAMAANFILWSLNVLKYVVKFVGMLISAFDLMGGGVKDAFSIVFNWVSSKINELIDKFKDIEVFGKKPFAWLENLKLPTMAIDGITGALDRFGKVQGTIDQDFNSVIGGWQNVLDEWSETINDENLVKNDEGKFVNVMKEGTQVMEESNSALSDELDLRAIETEFLNANTEAIERNNEARAEEVDIILGQTQAQMDQLQIAKEMSTGGNTI